MRGILSIAALSLITASAMGQVNLSALMVADDTFEASISTDPTTAGSEFLSGSGIFRTFSGSTLLAEPGTYYLQVRATDFGGQRMMIGLFTLDNALGSFSNGTSSLVSGVANWTVSDSGFGVAPVAPVVVPNGWGAYAGLESGSFIWHPSTTQTAYFTTQITVVPAPASVALLGLLAFGRRRR